MCLSLAELKAAVHQYASGFDPALVPSAQLPQLLDDAGAIEKMMATLSALIAARLAGLGPSATAPRQAARRLAQAAGTSLGQALRAMESARAIGAQPEVEAAARAGELSRSQAALVAGAVAANPGATGRLLELARTSSLSELAEEAARAQAAGLGTEERRQAVHASRALRSYTDAAGTWHLRAQGTPEAGAVIMAAVNAGADKAFEAARAEGRREGSEAYAFDGLEALARDGGGAGPRYEVVFRVDHAAFVRGYPLEGEVCEVAGFGPTSAQAVADVMDSGDPVLKAVVTRGRDVINVAHLGRRPNAHQQTALDWIFPTCAAEGCGTRASFLETDHRLEWAKCGVTVLNLLDRLCRSHHRLKTYQGWALVEGRGKRAFVAPDDPRHPRFTGRGADP